MADITSKIERANVPFSLEGFGDYEVYDVDLNTAGGLTAAAHDVLKIPAGKVFVDGFIIVTTAAASAGAATVAFALDSFSFGSAIAKANLTAGTVLKLSPGIAGGCVSPLTGSTPAVFKVTVGTAALTDFAFKLVVKTVGYAKMVNKG